MANTTLPPVPAIADGEGFFFSSNEIISVLTEWDRLQEELFQDAACAKELAGVLGPGKEPASENMATVATGSGEAFRKHSDSMQGFVEMYIANITQACNQYLMQDDTSRRNFQGG